MTFEAFTARLRGVQRTATGALAFCPAHDDRQKQSLSVSRGKDGRLLLKCFVGCTPEAIVAAMGVTMADLFPDDGCRSTGRRIVATYDYRDEAGTLLYQVVRYEPKDFRPRVPDGAGGRYGLPADVRRVLYRLPDLAEQRRVVWVEGEKDADRLGALGFAATTTQGGSGAWRDEYADQLVRAGAEEVVSLPDNDPAGERYALAVVRACLARGLRAKLVRLPDLPHKGDVSDWLDAGRDAAALEAVIAEHPWPMAPPAEAPIGAVPLATVLDQWLHETEAGHAAPVARTPFPSLNYFLVGGFAAGELVYLGARPGVGKSTLSLEIARAVAADGASVLVANREMVNLAVARRLVAQTARVSASSLRLGRLGDGEWVLVRGALPKLRGLPIWLTDQLVSVEEIETLVRGFAVTPPLGLLVVDYLQLVRGPRGIRERRLEVEAVSQRLKALAVERQIPVLCLSSLSRPADGKDRRPTLTSLRESGELEHDADVVLLLHREPNQGETECIVAKNRDGRTGTARLRFLSECVAFEELSEERRA